MNYTVYTACRVWTGSDVQRRVGAGKPSPGSRVQTAAGGRSRHLPDAVGQVAPVAATNGHRNR